MLPRILRHRCRTAPPGALDYGEFRRVDADTDVGRRVVNISEYSVDERPLVLRPSQPLDKYALRVTLNGDLAFAGQYDGTDMIDAIVG